MNDQELPEHSPTEPPEMDSIPSPTGTPTRTAPIIPAEIVDPSVSLDASPRMLTEEDLRSARPRRVFLPVMLFLVTCLSTFWAGATNWMPLGFSTGIAAQHVVGFEASVVEVHMALLRGWDQGLVYMLCVLAILLTHEMGHFLATIRYRIPASFPYFIPFPVSPIGTMGAVIGMEGYKANRRQMFDIGIAGPLAGLLVAIPVLWIGIQRLDMNQPGYGGVAFDCPWLVKILMAYLRPDVGAVESIWLSQLNPYFTAGWVGLLITGLNMLPISQLDGGHVIYTMFRKKAHWIARGFLFFAIGFIIFQEAYIWIVMVALVMLIGTDHPPTSDDQVPLGWPRKILGFVSLAIPFLCFPPKALIVVG